MRHEWQQLQSWDGNGSLITRRICCSSPMTVSQRSKLLFFFSSTTNDSCFYFYTLLQKLRSLLGRNLELSTFLFPLLETELRNSPSEWNSWVVGTRSDCAVASLQGRREDERSSLNQQEVVHAGREDPERRSDALCCSSRDALHLRGGSNLVSAAHLQLELSCSATQGPPPWGEVRLRTGLWLPGSPEEAACCLVLTAVVEMLLRSCDAPVGSMRSQRPDSSRSWQMFPAEAALNFFSHFFSPEPESRPCTRPCRGDVGSLHCCARCCVSRNVLLMADAGVRCQQAASDWIGTTCFPSWLLRGQRASVTPNQLHCHTSPVATGGRSQQQGRAATGAFGFMMMISCRQVSLLLQERADDQQVLKP